VIVIEGPTRDFKQLTRHIEDENRVWTGLDCEIEDLLNHYLIKFFIDENPRCLRRGRDPVVKLGGHHFEYADGFKAELFRFVQTYAGLAELDAIAETLKSLRYYLRLEPDGDPA
jgi:hypothetical protein